MRTPIAAHALLLASWLAPAVVPRPPRAADILAQSRAAYAALASYADEGLVTEEATGFVERARFRTSFRQPTHFFYEYEGLSTKYASGIEAPDRAHQVLWMAGGDLEKWDAVLRTHDTYPRAAGGQVSAVASTGARTRGTGVLIPSLLFSKSRLVGTIQEFADFEVAGAESVGGHPCHKLIGVARSTYPSGQVVNVRPTTVWIDTRTLLIRKVFTDTPKGYPAGSIQRLTITIEPRANPALADSVFRFVVPEAQE